MRYSLILLVLGLSLPVGAETLLVPGKQLSQIRLAGLDVAVEVQGFLVETTLTVTVRNEGDQRLDAEYFLTLPEGSGIDGYRLKIGDQWVDGVIADKTTARIAFDREIRASVDPGLVSWIDGVHYGLRVFPVDAQSERTFQVRYLSTLSHHGRFSWRCPLVGLPALRSLSLSVDLTKAGLPLHVTSHPFASADLEVKDGQGQGRAVDLKPEQDLVFEGESDQDALVMIEHGGDGARFIAVQAPPQAEVTYQANPNRLRLYWDTSYSREDADHDRALELVQTLLANWEHAVVDLVTFSNRVEPPRTFTPAQRDRLIATLENLIYDGGTHLAALTQAEDAADLTLLITDGAGNFSGLPNLPGPLLIYNPSTKGNHLLLAHLAAETDGIVVPMNPAEPVLTTAQRFLTPFQLTDIHHGEKEITHLERAGFRGLDVVSGQLHGRQAKLTLDYGFGGVTGASSQLTLRSRDARGGDMIARYQAVQTLRRLNRFPQYHRQEIMKLGRAKGLVTPHTSLLVLETLEQYVNYHIEPPAGLPKMRAAWHQEMAEDLDDDDLAMLREEVLQEWAKELAFDWERWLDEVNEPKHLDPNKQFPESLMAFQLFQHTGVPLTDYLKLSKESLLHEYQARLWPSEGEKPLPKPGDLPLKIVGMGVPLPMADLCLTSENGQEPIWLQTDLSGRVLNANLPPGDYKVEIQMPDFINFEHFITINSESQMAERIEMSMRPHLNRQEFDMVSEQYQDWGITAPSGVVVRVFENSGDPLPGVSVAFQAGDEVQSKISNRDGIAVSPKLTTPTVEIEAKMLGFNPSYRSVTVVPDATSQVAVVLYPASVIENLIVIDEASRVDVTTYVGGAAISAQTPSKSEASTPADNTFAGLKPWAPDADYLRLLAAAPKQDQRNVYLAQRRIHGQSPAFFFDCAHFFFNQGRDTMGFKALSSILELGYEDPELLKVVASVNVEHNRMEDAVALFEKVAALRPEQPKSYRNLALAQEIWADQLAEAGDLAGAKRRYLLALEVLAQTISEPWGPVSEPLRMQLLYEGRFEKLGPLLLTEYNVILAKWRRLGGTGPVPEPTLPPVEDAMAIRQDVDVDLRVLLEWDNEDVDADLLVMEPSDEIVWWNNQASQAGGMNHNVFSQATGPESYIIKKAPSGTYRFFVHYKRNRGVSRSGPTQIAVQIFTNYGRINQKRILKTMRLDEVDQMLDLGSITL